MKKNVRLLVVAATMAALPLAGIAVSNTASKAAERKALIQFVDYCKGCENLMQVNPAKDLTKAGTSELKTIARWYYDQDNFADCTDYPAQAEVNHIIGRSYSARIINK